MQNSKLFHPSFTLVVLGQIISLFGNAILSFALPLHLLKLTESGTIFGVVMAISIVPTILLSPIGGILADRVNRRNIMVALDFITCAIVLISGFFIESMAIPVISMTLILLSVIRSFYQPAVQSSIPTITTEKNLLKGNSVVNMISSVATLVGPILGGVLYAYVGLLPIIYISSIAFFLSAVMELFIKMPFVKKALTQGVFKTIQSDFSESIYFVVKKESIIGKTLIIAVLINLLATSFIMVGIPYIINITLGLSSELYGVAQSAIGFGSLIGGILVGFFSVKLKMSHYHLPLMFASLAFIPIGIALMIPSNPMLSYWIVLISTTAIMGSATMFSIIAITFIQQLTPLDLTGKVMALVVAFTTCAVPLGQAAYGFLFENLPNHSYLIVFVTALLLFCIVFLARKIWSSRSDELLEEKME